MCFSWHYMLLSIIWNASELSALNLSRATAILVVDCCQFGTSWIFGLKMDLMAYADLVCGKTEQSCIFIDLKWWFQLYETLPKLSPSHLSPATAILVVDCCQVGPSWILGWNWSLWPVPTWLSVFFMTLHVSINDIKNFWTVCITPQPCHSHFCCWWLPIWP